MPTIRGERSPAAQSNLLRSTAPAATATVLVIGVLAVYVGALVATGSDWRSVLSWLLAVVVGVVAPGFVLVRAVRPARAPLVEDLSWGGAVGLAVALAGWLVDRLLPWSPGPLLFGPFLIALVLMVPRTRVRALAKPAPGWGTGPAVALGVTHLVAVGWMLSTALRGLPPRPSSAGTEFIPDMLYQVALTGELGHAVAPTYPMVAGQPLSYHWFVYAIQAHLLQVPGTETFDAVLRLMPVTLVAMLISIGAVVARQVAGKVAAGPVAAALLVVVGNSLPVRWVVPNGIPTRWAADGGALEAITVYWQDSPPQSLSWVVGIAVFGVAVAFVRRSSDDATAPRLLLVPLLVVCVGAKSSQLPVLVCGFLLALGVALVAREMAQVKRLLLVLGAAGVVTLLAARTIYVNGSYGLTLRPGERLDIVGTQLFVGVVQRPPDVYLGPFTAPTSALVTAAIVYLLPIIPRLLGLGLLARRRVRDPATWISVGTLVGGITASMAFRHPASSEVFFLVSALPVAMVGSAAGFVVGLEPHWRRLAGRGLPAMLALGGSAFGFAVALVVARAHPLESPRARWVAEGFAGRVVSVRLRAQELAWLLPHAELWGVACAALVVVAVVLALVTAVRRRGRWRRIWSVSLVLATTCALGTGLPATWLHLHRADGITERQAAEAASARAVAAGNTVVTPDLFAAGEYVRNHSEPSDVVATNRICTRPTRLRADRLCDAREFAIPALTGRRTDVSGWAYSDRAVSHAFTLARSYVFQPFWDPTRLDQEQAAITEPTESLLDTLWSERGVRWIIADRRVGPVAEKELDQLADRRFTAPEVDVWQLRAPRRR